MSKWQRIAAAFPLVMALIEQADAFKSLTRGTAEWDQAIVSLVDLAVTAVETAVGRDLIDNQKLKTAILAALDVK